MNGKADYGKSGDVYVPYKDRTGAESMVFFTRDLSAEGLVDHSQYSRQKIRRNHKESKYSFSNSFGVL